MKASKTFAGILTYIVPVVAIILYYLGAHRAFLSCSFILLTFLLAEIILKIVKGSNWIIKYKPIMDIIMSFLLGGLITGWNPLDSLCIGVCAFQVIVVYEAFFRKLFNAMQIKTNGSHDSIGETISGEEITLATRDEMKAEAVYRMKQIGLVDSILNDFVTSENIQVYEPPYGCGYGLEDEDLNVVRTFEGKHNTLVWGVIRSFKNYDGEDVTIDALLYVSENKKFWDIERENLFNLTPIVYTVVKEHPERIDIGCMEIYMSEGGTPLRSE